MRYLVLFLVTLLMSCNKMENLIPEDQGFKYFELHIQTKNARVRLDINGQTQTVGDTAEHKVTVFLIEDIQYVFVDKIEGDKVSVSLQTNKHKGKNYGWITTLSIWGKDADIMKLF